MIGRILSHDQVLEPLGDGGCNRETADLMLVEDCR